MSQKPVAEQQFNQQSLYGLLNIERSASSQDIQKAFRKLALIHHPDKGGDPETFKSLRQAYEVLSDEGKRRQYDQTGQIPGDQVSPPPQNPFGFPFDIGNLFGMFGPGGKPQNMRKAFKPPPKTEILRLTLAQLYFGHTFQIHLDRSKQCVVCSGTGAKRKEVCGACGGSGSHTQTMNLGGMMMHSQGPCMSCTGEGMRILESCDVCKGLKKVHEKKAIDVKIPASIMDGEMLTFQEVCSELPEFEKAGDLVLTIASDMTGGWKRQGQNLMNLEIEVVLNLAESLLGTVIQLDGHPGFDDGLFIEIPPASFTGDVYCITGQGMPIKGTMNNYGDLYVRIRVVVKMAERKELVSSMTTLQDVFKAGCRTTVVPADSEVQKEVFLTKLP